MTEVGLKRVKSPGFVYTLPERWICATDFDAEEAII